MAAATQRAFRGPSGDLHNTTARLRVAVPMAILGLLLLVYCSSQGYVTDMWGRLGFLP